MKRRPFNILSALLLVLCVWIALLWTSSYSMAHSILHATSTSVDGVERWHYKGVESTYGALVFTDAVLLPPSPDAHADARGVGDTVTEYLFIMPLGYTHLRGTPTQYSTQFLGFFHATRDGYQRTFIRRTGIPYWFLLTATATLPLSCTIRRWLLRRQWTHRLNHGLCPKCGYDLRASPGRCPECGTPIPAKAGDTIERG